jgi:molecular chaperone HscB
VIAAVAENRSASSCGACLSFSGPTRESIRALNDHFSLFALPARFEIDAVALDRAYKDVQAKVHPDRFVSSSAAERRVAMQWATRANEAFAVLRSPLRRAAYLCELRGVPISAESNTAMPREFLLRQMQWREALDEATCSLDASRLAGLRSELDQQRSTIASQVSASIDQHNDMLRAADLVRQWMFIERFGEDVNRASHAAEDAPDGALKRA